MKRLDEIKVRLNNAETVTDEGVLLDSVIVSHAAADFSDPNLSDWETALVRSYLLTRANKLKANTAFTDMVQLGQEIEGNNE